MRQAIPGILLVMLIAILLISGCSKNPAPTDPIVYNNMTDNKTVPIDVVDPVVNESIIITNTTVIVNETIVNETVIDNSTIIVDDPDSKYYQYRDTGLIDESIDDIESLD